MNKNDSEGIFTCKIKDMVLNDLLHDLEYCYKHNEKITLGSARIEILLGYIDYLIKWIKYEKEILKEAREKIEKHTTKFNDIYIPASESWYLLEILDKENI